MIVNPDDKLMTNDQRTNFQARISVSDLGLLVEVAGRYSNRPELLEQLRKLAAILPDDGQGDGAGAKVSTECVIRSRRLRDRFPLDDLQMMIDLYRSGIAARKVAEKFKVSLSSVKRVLRQHGVHRRCER